jgi:hypothetical protein
MRLPCFFTKQFREGDAVMVCSHVWEENIRQGWLLPIRLGKMERHDPPTVATYEDGSESRCDVTVKCLECAPKPDSQIDLVELKWSGGRLSLSETAARA